MNSPELPTILNALAEDIKYDLHTGLPGAVQKYDKTKKEAEIVLQVKMLVPRASGGYDIESYPVLQHVPVKFTRSKKYYTAFPLEQGDTGLVLFTEASIAQWRAEGTLGAPDDIGRHTLTGGVFLPGLMTDSDNEELTLPDDDALCLGVRGGSFISISSATGCIHIDNAGGDSIKIGGAAAAEPLVLGTALKTWLTDLLNTYHGTHTHPTGTGPSGPPIEAATLTAKVNGIDNFLSDVIQGKKS